MARKLVVQMTVRQPGRKLQVVAPLKQSPEQHSNTVSQIRFGKKALAALPRFASLYASDKE